MVKFDALKTAINVLRLWADGLFARKRDVALKSDIPTDEHINALIAAALESKPAAEGTDN